MFEVETGIIFWNTVAFAVLVLVMYRWALPPLLKMMQEREKTIADSLTSADESQKQAEELLASARQKIAEASLNAQKMVDQAVAEGERLKKDIIHTSKKEAEIVMLKAREDLQREKKEIISAVRAQTADLVVAAAGRVIRQKIDKTEDQKLIEESLKACQP